MINCLPQTSSEYVITCARVCSKLNQAPIADMQFDEYLLIDVSTYFDNGVDTNRQVRWEIYVGEYLIYDFGYGFYNDAIPELGNGSMYSILNLGLENEDIINFLETLPSTIITPDIKFTVKMTVKDNTGVESENSITTYNFHKII